MKRSRPCLLFWLAVDFKIMKEREKYNQAKQDEKTVHHLPPVWCGSICRNSMNEMCVEHCAVERDCSVFEPKPNLKLEDMPRFPLKGSENMTKEERFTSVTVYLAKVVDHLKGVDDEAIYPPIIRRKDIYRAGSVGISENIEVKDLLPGVQKGNSSSENRKKRQDSPDRSSEMDGRAGQAT